VVWRPITLKRRANCGIESQLLRFVLQQAFGSVIALNAAPIAQKLAAAITHNARARMCAVWCAAHRTGLV
jgi:hypothetical protein